MDSMACCGIPELLISFILRLKQLVTSGLIFNFQGADGRTLYVAGRSPFPKKQKMQPLSSYRLFRVCIWCSNLRLLYQVARVLSPKRGTAFFTHFRSRFSASECKDITLAKFGQKSRCSATTFLLEMRRLDTLT